MLTTTNREAVRYWEVRRLILNVLLIAAANFGWGIANSFNVGIDDLPGARFTDPGIPSRFCWVFFGLNLVFSLGYVGEYFFQNESKKKIWPFPIRTILLCVISLFLVWMAAKAGSTLAHYTSIEKALYTPKK